jgi:hypothetical protein
MEAATHGCHLLNVLENDNPQVLEWYEQRCSGYIGAVEHVENAEKKITMELLGTTRKGYRPFQSQIGF